MRSLLIVAVAALLAAPAAALDAAPVWEPDPTQPGLRGATWQETGPGYAIHLQRIDDEARRAFLEARAGAEVDPFASPPDAPSRFLTFVVQIENLSTGTLQFQPQNSWLVRNGSAVQYPIGIEQLRASFRTISGRMPETYDAAAPVVLAESQSLAPGERVDGLLVYRAVPPKTKRFHVEIQLVSPTGDVVRFRAPYLRQPTKKKRKSGAKR